MRSRILRISEVVAGSKIFVDATIFIYHFTGLSHQCRGFLERCERGEIAGVTSTTVLAETSHRLMMIEAVARGLVEPGNVASKLRSKRAIVRKLNVYQEQLDRIPLMGIAVHSVDVPAFDRSRHGRAKYGLLTNDSLVLASAENAAVDGIATADRDFNRIREVEVFTPSDLKR